MVKLKRQPQREDVYRLREDRTHDQAAPQAPQPCVWGKIQHTVANGAKIIASCRRQTVFNLVLALRERASRDLALFTRQSGHTRAKLETDSELLDVYARHDGAAAEGLTAAALEATTKDLLPRIERL